MFVAPDGTGSACTEASPCELHTAVSLAGPADVVFLRGGVYSVNESISFDNAGTPQQPISFESYPAELAIIDGSANQLGDSVYFRISGEYYQIRRLEIRNMPRQGLYIGGCHNMIDGIHSHNNGLTGIQIVSPYDEFPYGEYGSFNTLVNCVSHDNYDEGTSIPGFNDGDNADGFCMLTLMMGLVMFPSPCSCSILCADGFRGIREKT